MALKKIKVTYRDGREVEVEAFPNAQLMTEQHLDGFTVKNVLHGIYYLGWAALYKAGKESTDFLTWMDQVKDVEDVEDVPADPTQPDPSGDGSSESAS